MILVSVDPCELSLLARGNRSETSYSVGTELAKHRRLRAFFDPCIRTSVNLLIRAPVTILYRFKRV